MSNKTLRLGFVMGGGVSLGSFSGAALSEAIKQHIVYAQYDTGEKDAMGNPIHRPYDKIEIDVFSGASAGAVALAIMLRVLANPFDKHQLLGFKTPEEYRAHLERKVYAQFADHAWQLKTNSPEKFECLIAAQSVQEFQEKIWVYDVDMDRLLGVGKHPKNLRGNAGLVDRNVVDNLARDYFPFKTMSNRLEGRRLLADRVLFGCTLANLTHTFKNPHRTATSSLPTNRRLLKALNDTSVDRVHSELRVFDINFQPIMPEQAKYLPLKWVQLHPVKDVTVAQNDSTGRSYIKNIRSLQHNNSWKEIAATAIASAAFPLAFEPVALNRYQYEFAEDWAEELRGLEKFPFTYVDGGMFNNEPIREATRMATYLDTMRSYEAFDRRIIFVDPNVGELENQFRVNIHSNIGTSRSFFSGKAQVGEKSTLSRLAGTVPLIIGAMINEAQTVEMGKIGKALERFEHRRQLRHFYRSLVNTPYTDEHVIQLRQYVIQQLDLIRIRLEMPVNTLQIQQELLRILKEEKDFLLEPLGDATTAFEKMQELVYIPTPAQMDKVGYWVYALMCIALDISLDLIGKTQNMQIVPIAPFNFYLAPDAPLELLRLPGAGLAGFAGFASFEASLYETQYGRYCAQRVLKELDYLRPDANPLPLPLAFDYSSFSPTMKGDIERALLKRIKEVLPESLSSVMPFIEGYLTENVRMYIQQNLTKTSTGRSYEFRIQIPSDLFSLRGFDRATGIFNKNRLEPVKIDNAYYLVTTATYYTKEQRWEGAHVGQQQQLEIDKMRLFDDKAVLSIRLPLLPPDHPAHYSPNPVFTLDGRGNLGIVTGHQQLDGSVWKWETHISALDENLWGQDNLQDLINRS